MGFGHGKLILLGEHGVVYGRPAIAAALPRGAEALAKVAEKPRLEVEPWGVAFDADAEQPDPRSEMLRQAFRALLAAYPKPPPLCVHARIALPGSAGLGGSAALSVAIVRAIDEVLGIERGPGEVAEVALAAERVFHGNPSGVDTALASSGGVAVYRKGSPLEPVKLGRKLTLVVGDSGEPGSTAETVASVGRQHARNPQKLEQIFDGMEALVNNGRSALVAGELWRLGQLMVLNQKLLSTLMLSTSRLEEMCEVAENAGALGAKLTGGGGGGCMIALCEHVAQAERVQAALAELSAKSFVAEVGP
ncbi:MAG: mevalonate kinase [Polyangiales bacterium]